MLHSLAKEEVIQLILEVPLNLATEELGLQHPGRKKIDTNYHHVSLMTQRAREKSHAVWLMNWASAARVCRNEQQRETHRYCMSDLCSGWSHINMTNLLGIVEI